MGGLHVWTHMPNLDLDGERLAAQLCAQCGASTDSDMLMCCQQRATHADIEQLDGCPRSGGVTHRGIMVLVIEPLSSAFGRPR